jgi:hypothetical protein
MKAIASRAVIAGIEAALLREITDDRCAASIGLSWPSSVRSPAVRIDDAEEHPERRRLTRSVRDRDMP